MKRAFLKLSTSLLIAAIACQLFPELIAAAGQVERSKEVQIQVSNSQDDVVNKPGPAIIKYQRGTKVIVNNRTTGPIRIIGWDKDFIEATATSRRGLEAVRVDLINEESQSKIVLKADYMESLSPEDQGISTELRERKEAFGKEMEKANTEINKLKTVTEKFKLVTEKLDEKEKIQIKERGEDIETKTITRESDEAEQKAREIKPPTEPSAPKPAQAATTSITPSQKWDAPAKPDAPQKPDAPKTLVKPPASTDANVQFVFPDKRMEIDLEVKLPRYAEIESIRVVRSNVEVKEINTPITVIGDKGTVRLARVSAVEVKTNSGSIDIEHAGGLVDVTTTSGTINVRNTSTDVRARSISGNVYIECASGRVDIGNIDGSITVTGIKGDLDATTTNSDVKFASAIREDGRYHLKSIAGAVEMLIPAGSPGFTAALSSYRGGISTDFALKIKDSNQNAAINRRLIGRLGNGQAQISLDSFDGAVKLNKITPDSVKACP